MERAAVISLMNTIECVVYSSRISLVPPSPEIIRLAYQEAGSLIYLIAELDGISRHSKSKSVKAVDAQLREAVCKLEDVIESHVSNQLLSQFECLDGKPHPLKFSIDLQDLKQDIDSFREKVEELETGYEKALLNSLPEEEEEEDDDNAISSISDFGGEKSKMVGLSDQFESLRSHLLKDGPYVRDRVTSCPIVGMPGIGKTTLAKKVFEDPQIVEHFDLRVWLTVGQKRQWEEVLRAIVAQVDPRLKDKMLTVRTEIIAKYLKERLENRRYLIVLDDIWDIRVVFPLEIVSKSDKGNRVLLTSRQQNIDMWDHLFHNIKTTMRLLNKEESWDLFREKVFAEELCPPQLEKPGKKIAQNCEGLPLTIVTVANLLSKAEKTPEYWNKVAEKRNSVFRDAYDNMLEVLYPSYEYLPQYLKACFLYMGVFPQKYQIPRSNIINRLIAEGFLATNSTPYSKSFFEYCLAELVSNSLVMVYQSSTIPDRQIKRCGLHSSLWHLSMTEAEKNRFFHILNSCPNSLEEYIKSQRRLCIHNNVLFGIKSVCNSIEDNCASTARSLLCFGPYHQYQVPICFGLRLLRVLDALTIRFYEFPMEVLTLVQLRYLAVTYNGNLPASIAKLWNLQFLIIHRHLSIKSCGAPSYVPLEIWDMQELQHIQIMGSNLPNPSSGTSLQNLSTLLDVSSASCTEEVLGRISSLKKLGIRIESTHDVTETLGGLNRISCLDGLESLKCVVVNPEFNSRVVAPPALHLMFPHFLRKLTLSGFGYPWESMRVIASLRYLLVLKLQCYAFRGPKWEIEDDRFEKLTFLIIEDTDLVQWKIGRGSLPCLEQLRIKHCYKLEEIHMEADSTDLSKIEVVDCNPLAAAQLLKKYGAHGLDVHSSWDDRNVEP